MAELEEKSCYEKIFGNPCVLFLYFCAAFTAMLFASGGMVQLGALVLENTNHKGYEVYKGNTGFDIGFNSAAFLQYCTAIMLTAYMKLSSVTHSSHPSEKLFIRAAMLLPSMLAFCLFHYQTLPVAQNIVLNCGKKESATHKKHHLCRDTKYHELFASLYTGFAISMVPLLLIFSMITCCEYLARRNRQQIHDTTNTTTNDDQAVTEATSPTHSVINMETHSEQAAENEMHQVSHHPSNAPF